MKSLILICGLCSIAGLGFAQMAEMDCNTIGETVEGPCASCMCEEATPGSALGIWACSMTCDDCPANVIETVCIYNQCEDSSCPKYPDAVCKITDCGTCDPHFFLNDAQVFCGVGNCPAGLVVHECLLNPCDNEECMLYPMAECRPNYCGGCSAEFYDVNDNLIDCSVPIDCTMHNPCLNNGICYTAQDITVGYFCLCIKEFTGTNCETAMMKPGYCPSSMDQFGVCGECSLDNECPEDKKCCQGGCCTDPQESNHLYPKCPAGLPFMNCSYEEICSMSTCDFYPNARCLVDHCGGCNAVFVGVEGVRLNCSSGEVTKCPPGVMETTCLANPCDIAECPADLMARCVVVRCGMCHAQFVNTEGLHVDCQTGEARACPPGYQNFVPTGFNPCANATCPSDRMAKCVIAPCVKMNAPMIPPVQFFNASAHRIRCDRDSGCPAGRPFTNCSYEEVCSQPTCDFYPDARCLVDHCGGCRPVFVGFKGVQLDCTSGEVIKCPAGEPEVTCLVNPCDTAECPAAPMARCVVLRCRMCQAKFVNEEGRHVNCQTGETTSCPHGLVEDNWTEMDVCEGAVCPSNPKAKCFPSRCMNPNRPLECPVEFYDVRARLVMCRREKRGRCPMVRPGIGGICVEECEDDTDCEEREKCCSNGCGHTCRDPDMEMQEKPGMCPIVEPGVGGICVESCMSDGECDGRMKCCSNGCGHACRSPHRPVKPGMCPMVMPGMGGICVQECEDDGECDGRQKCCSNGCGNVCRGPLMTMQGKPGMCPMVQPGMGGLCVESCMNDTQCDGNMKCCSNGCGHVCQQPEMQIKPGMCPRVEPGSGGICVEECMNDTQCEENMKCCSNGCGHVCRLPEMQMKPGMCPMMEPGVGVICVEECMSDSECDGHEKCCSNGCGHTCRTPKIRMKPGMCPMVQPGFGGICVESCMNDTQCEGNRKCCSNGCGHVCQEPDMQMKPGMCPMVQPGMGGLCVESCMNDTQCDGNMKCCSNGCGHACRQPLTPMKPGICPMLQPSVGGLCVEDCMADGQCPEDKKCCSNGCGHVCVVAERPRKPGICPIVRPGAGGICVEYCTSDSNCENNKKCCSNGCGHTCREPQLPVKPGMCPRMEPGSGGICVEECMNDTQCEENKKCCSNGCGHVCREPEERMEVMMMKPGTCPMPTMDHFGFCGECTGDAQCGGRKKCCNQGCGFRCMEPIEMPGECPHVQLIPGVYLGSCEEHCLSDMDCDGEANKCCSNGCGTMCKEPIRGLKPGTCPMVHMGLGGICVEECGGDEECPDRMKCCSNGCGHACMSPQEEPGDCPHAMPGGMTPQDILQALCNEDEDCFGKGHHSKCCSYGCRHVCVAPVRVEKPGMCPKQPEGVGGICVQNCNGDQECQGNKKCCSNGCGYDCFEPEDVPGSCPYIRDDIGGTCQEECEGDIDCERGEKCCSNNCGHVCMPVVEVEKEGTCPDIRGGPPRGGCESNCVGDGECPGRSRCCDVGCGMICLYPKPPPVECSEDEPELMCDPNPCDHASCPSHPEAQCAPNMCGKCRPEFLDKQGMPVFCSGQTHCRGLHDREKYMPAGTIDDSSDGCNQCVCTLRETWECTKIDCGLVIKVTMVLDGSFEMISNRMEMFINKLKMFLSSKFDLPIGSFKDVKISSGSIVVEFKVSSDDPMDSTIVEETVQDMKMEVESGQLVFEFEGEKLQARRDSFRDDEVVDPVPKHPPKWDDNVMFIALAVIGGVVVLIVLIAIVSCVVKGKKEKKEKKNSENLEFNEYPNGVPAKEWNQ